MRVMQWIGAALAAMLLASCVYVGGPVWPRQPEDDARLLYEMELTAPGTRSQGWRGVLYGRNGFPVQLQHGQRADTPAGRFVGVRCEHPWSACGAIHEDMLAWMRTHEHNIQMGRERWSYRLTARGFYGDRLEGVLLRDGRSVAEAREARTPFGPFRWIDGRRGLTADRHGWFHRAWR